MLSATTLRTDRLVLDPLRVEDAPAMVEVLADERMYEFTGGRPPTSQELRERYGRLVVGRSPDGSEAWLNWIVRLAAAPSPVGVVQATVAADGTTADVAWEVGVPWQGQGIAGEAATELVRWLESCGVGEVRALVHRDHAASAAVARRAGLHPTGAVEDGEVVWARSTG